MDVGETPDTADDNERCSEQVERDVNEEQSHDVPDESHQPRLKPSQHHSCVKPSQHQPRLKPSRRKKSKPSKAEHVTESRSLAENVDANSVFVPDEEDSSTKRKRSAGRLADRLQSPLLEVIEAGDADDFADEVEHPVEVHQLETMVEVHEPDVFGCTLPPVDHSSCPGITAEMVRSQSEAATYGEAEQSVDDTALFDIDAGSAEPHVTDVVTVSRSRVRTPPTFEETSAILQAIEEAGRISPVDVTELVDRWKRAKSPPQQDTDTDDELPSFNVGLKSYRRVLNGKTVDRRVINLESGYVQSDLHSVEQQSSPSAEQKPLQETVKTSRQVDQRKGSSEYESNKDVLRMWTESIGHDEFGEGSDLPYTAADCNQMSVNTVSGNSKHGGNEATEKGAENSGFSRPRNFSPGELESTVKQHNNFCGAVEETKLYMQQNFNLVDDFISDDDDMNDDEFLAAATETSMVQSGTDRRQVTDSSEANVVYAKIPADNSQLTFTQALACVHDFVDSRTGSPNVHGKCGKADRGLEKSMRIDEARFDLGFEFSDDDEWDDDDDGDLAVDAAPAIPDDDDDDDDIIPPSPPASGSWKSSVRMGGRPNSLITISRQNSCGSFTASGPQTSLLEDAKDAGSHKSQLVAEDSEVGNASTSKLPGLVEHLLPDKRSKGSMSLAQDVVRLGAPAVVKKSTDSSATPPAAEQKSRNSSDGNESKVVMVDQQLTDLPPLTRSGTAVTDEKSIDRLLTVDEEQKSREQRMAQSNSVAASEKWTYLGRANHVAVIRPCVRSLATPTTPASQSEAVLLTSVLSTSTPFKLGSVDKCGKFALLCKQLYTFLPAPSV